MPSKQEKWKAAEGSAGTADNAAAGSAAENSSFKDGFNKALIEEKFRSILGQETVKQDLKSALYMDRHVILVGPPGVGKTTLARGVAEVLPDMEMEVNDGGKLKKKMVKGSERFIRVQGSPDLTAEDLLGDIDPMKALQYGPLSKEAFQPGKIFRADKGVLFFDEINRCSEKLQNALLQVLEERKMTIASYTMDFSSDFIFIGTMNPEDTSTEPLSDVFLDRFDLIHVGYPETLAVEEQIVRMKGKSILPFPEELFSSTMKFIRQLRTDANIEKKPSVRASIGVYERAQSNAMLSGRDEVTQEDINAVLVSVLAHRIKLKPSVRYLETPEKYVENAHSRFCRRETSDLP